MKKNHSFLHVLALLMLVTFSAKAQLLVYEGANYAVDATNSDPDGGLQSGYGYPASNSVNGTLISTGLRGVWTTDIVVASGLTYSNSGGVLSTTGNALRQVGTNYGPSISAYATYTGDPFAAYRTAASANVFGYNATKGAYSLYFSVLLNSNDLAVKKNFQVRSNIDGNDGNNGGILIQQNPATTSPVAAANWELYCGSASKGILGTAVKDQTILVVGRIDFTAANTATVSVWFNPTLNSALPAATQTFTITDPTKGTPAVAVIPNILPLSCRYGTGTLSFDEFRLGLTAADVMPTVAPVSLASVPTGLSTTTPTSSSFTLSWAASSNVGVSGYDVFRDGVIYKSSNTTSLLVEGVASTAYSMTVKAKDAAGVASPASAPLVVTTAVLVPVDYIVAKTGNDLTGDGSLGNPFLTIQKAANVAGLSDIINVRAGTYREMVDIKANGVSFQPYLGESVTVNGAELMTAWTLASGTTYQTPMNWDVDPNYGSNQLFADGSMLELARWPDQTSADIVMPTNAIADLGASSKVGVLTLTDADFNEPDGRWVGGKIWMNLSRDGFDGEGFTAIVTATSSSAHTITMAYIDSYNDTPVLTANPWGVGKNTEYFLFDPTPAGVAATGGVDALLSKGEWWKDGNTLYVKTKDGSTPSTSGTGTNVVEAKKRHFAFYSSATKNSYTIKGFNLFACAITTDYNVWTMYKTVANRTITEAAHDIVIDGITANYPSHQTDMAGNKQAQHSAWTGFVISGRNNTLKNCNIQFTATSAVSISGVGNKVLNNTITNTNYLCSNAGAVNTGYACQDAEIGYNTISNTTVTGIYFNGAKNSSLATPDLFRIHHNTIYNFMRRSGDSGAIDEAVTDLNGARIDHNIIYNTTPVIGGMVHGIYLDYGGGATGDLGHVTVDHNIVYDVPSPIFMNNLRFVNVYNNVALSLASANDYGIKYGNGASKGLDNKVYNNISSKGVNNLDAGIVRNNITNANGTVLTDLFVNAAAHDYHLKSTALTALDQGISVGVYDEALIGGVPDLGAYESGTFADAVAPSVPANVVVKTLLTDGFTLNWTAATDNSGGFVSYDIYKDGILVGNTHLTSYTITGLTESTTYAVTIKAIDTHGNASAASTVLNVKTLSKSTLHIEAESSTLSGGGSINTVGAWGNLKTGVFLQYNGVNLCGQDLFKAKITSTRSDAKLEIHLNSTTGPLLGTLVVAATGSGVYTQQTTALTGVPKGSYTLVLVPVTPVVGNLFLDWFELSDMQAPTTPTGLTASAISATAFALNWTASTDNVAVSGYDVYNGATLLGSSVGTGTAMNIVGLTASTAYTVTLVAKDAAGFTSPASSSIAVNTTAVVDATAPGVPTALSASAILGTSFTLSWTAPTDNVGIGGYEAYNGATLIGKTIGTATTMNITGLTGLVTYPVTLYAKDVVGNTSGASAALSVLTLDNDAPSVPGNFVISVPTTSSFTVDWTATDNVAVASYDVYKDGTFITITTNPSASFTGLSSATTYLISVKAKDAVGNSSAISTPLSVTTYDNAALALHLEAESYSFRKGGYKSITNNIIAIGGMNTNDYLRFDSVLLSGQTTFKANISRKEVQLQKFEIRYGTDTIIGNSTSMGTLWVAATLSWDIYTAQSTTLTGVPSGKYYVFLLGLNGPYGVANVDWIEISGRPVTPTALVASNKTTTGFTLAWTVPTDLSITGYDVFNNGTLVGSTTTATSLDISGLVTDTPYLMTVVSKNAAGTTSGTSATLSVTLGLTDVENHEAASIAIYAKDDQIVANLSGMNGASIVTVFDIRGVMVNLVKTTETQLTLNVPNKGFYLVRVQKAGKQFIQKVVVL